MTRRRACAIVWLIVGALFAPEVARADKTVSKKMWFAEKSGKLVVNTSFTELFDAKAYAALDSGFASTIILRAYVYDERNGLPVALSLATFRVAYDLWDETYLVRIEDGRGQKNWRFNRRADALKAVTEVDAFPLAALSQISIGPRYYCLLIVELNPVSEERLAEMRRWMTRRAGSTEIDTNSSFFGSFVSVFVNPKMQGSDAVLRIQSQPFFRQDDQDR